MKAYTIKELREIISKASITTKQVKSFLDWLEAQEGEKDA